MPKVEASKRRRGAKPTGPGGSRVSDLPGFSCKMIPEQHERLMAQALREERAAWRIVRDAVGDYLDRVGG